MPIFKRYSLIVLLGLSVLVGTSTSSAQQQGDLVLERVYEAALDLPRIYFLVKRDLQGPPLMNDMGFQAHYAFLDTGASGILFSQPTVNQLGIKVEPQARFADVGVGGVEFFRISEPLILGVAGYHLKNPRDLSAYRSVGRGRFEIKEGLGGLLGGTPDVIGMPVMMGRVVVLDTGATNEPGHFAADIRPPGDPSIPKVHLAVKLRLEAFSDPQDKRHIPPLPVLAPNPVIDNVILMHRGQTSRASWLFDTGGTISLISTRQAQRLGLVNAQGQSTIEPAFLLPVGGVGHMTQIRGYQIERLVVPMVNGRKLIYINARIGVHDIAYTDPKTKTSRTLDGVFGSNFLCASARMAGLLPSDTSETIFDKVVIDFPKELLGLRLRGSHAR